MKPSERIHKTALALIEGSTYLAVFFLPISKAMVELGSCTALILWYLLKLFYREEFLVPRTIRYTFIPFLMLAVFSTFWADPNYTIRSVRGALKYLQYLGFFVVCTEFFANEVRRKRLYFVFLASMILVTFNGFFQLANGTDFLRNVSLDPGRIIRMKSSLGAANTLAAFYFFSIPLTLSFLLQSKKRRVLWSALLILFTAGFILTYSRAAFFALAACFFIFLLLRKKFTLALALTLSVFALIFLIPPLRHNFIESINLDDTSLKERLIFWAASWDLIKEQPWLGCGINMYYVNAPIIQLPQGLYQGYAHNSYLQMWAETGITGLLLFSSGIFFTLRENFKRFISPEGGFTAHHALWVGGVSFLLINLIDTHFFSLQSAVLFWLFLGLLNSYETKRSMLA